MKKNLILLFTLLLSACAASPAGSTQVPSVTPTRGQGVVALLSTPRPAPTPIPFGETVIYEGLSIRVEQAELNEEYETEFGTMREAPEGRKFLWIQLLLETVENIEAPLPDADHFSALYGTIEFKPTYGHRDRYTDYTSLPDTLFPDNPRQAWLRFDIPLEAEPADLRFAFLPDSTWVSFSKSASGASYYDHPVYLWKLEPQ